MDKINWSNFNYDDFEIFCNGLLTFEFGKNYQPFSAPGRDGGIDGAYSGQYQDLNGNWRFQFKFFQVPRGEGVKNLRFQVKKEAGKLFDENYFVLLTNVELLPQEVDSLQKIFYDEIESLGKSCFILVWDGAKIFNLLLRYPILMLWLNDGFSTAQVQHYNNVFYKSLQALPYEPSSMSGMFISREKPLDDLRKFYISDDNIMLISGEAGVGKTRLVIEFFKQEIDPLENWLPLVLMNKNIDFDKLKKAFSSEHNYLVLIDDAHNYSQHTLSDLKALADNSKNKVKLILTSRTIETSQVLKIFKESDHIQFIGLDVLTPTATASIFKYYLEKSDFKHYINQLIQISFGRPLLIMAILNAVFNNTPISEIKQQNFLRKYVNNYFDMYLDEVQNFTNVSKFSLKKLLQNLVLIEPINFSDINLLTRISELHCIKLPELREALDTLVRAGVVNGSFEQSIKPDYYSDILLSEIKQSETLEYVNIFSDYINNIIVNLSSVAEIDKDNRDYLRVILNGHVKRIENLKEIKEIEKILFTVRNISYVQPEIAMFAVEIFVKNLEEKESFILSDYNERKKLTYNITPSPVIIVIDILSILYEDSANSNFILENSFRMYKNTFEAKISGIFAFSKRDALEKFSMVRQSLLIEFFSKKVKSHNEDEILLLLACCKYFTALDFTLTDWDPVYRENIILTTYYLPASTSVKKFRKNVLNLLFKLYQNSHSDDLKSQILKFIIDIPRAIFATNRNNSPYKNDSEIKAVFEFLVKEGAKFNLDDQKEILDKLYWFDKWGLSEDLKPLILEIKEVLKPKNLTERIAQLFSKAEVNILEIPNIEQFIEEKCDEIISGHSTTELSESLTEFLAVQKFPPVYYFYFQNIIEYKYPEYAEVVHNKMYDNSMRLYSIYGSRILSSLYFKHKKSDFYWNQVDILQKLNTSDADNVILSVYSDKVPGSWHLTKDDMELIIKIFEKKDEANNYQLATALQNLFALDYFNVLKICSDYLDRAAQRGTEMFFIRLSDNQTVSSDQLKHLVLNHTIKYQLSYEIELCLNKILVSEECGLELVFQYLISRFEYQKNILLTSKSFGEYEFVQDGKHTHLFNNCDPIIRQQMFFKGLDWYLNIESDGGHLYYAKDLLGYLRPQSNLTIEMANEYRDVIDFYSNKIEKLKRILYSLSIYQTKDELLLETVMDTVYNALEIKDEKNEEYAEIKEAAYLAIISMGVKSGPANQPFKQDLDLKDLIIKYINNQVKKDASISFLNDVLFSVEQEINRSLDKNNDIW